MSDLYLKDLKKGDRFKVVDVDDCPTITFSHLDGMYSFNTTDDGGVVHLRHDTPVELDSSQ